MADLAINNRTKGNKAEDIAIEFLTEKGFQIIKRNFTFGKAGEIDIVCKDKDVLVFVEVKSRSSYEYGDPTLSMSNAKIKNIRRVAEAYLYVNKIENVECRFDFIGIDLRTSVADINYIPNAF